MNIATKLSVDLEAIRSNARAIRERTGVDVIGVIKADAYGCGMRRVVEAIDDIVTGWYVLHPHEAIEKKLSDVSLKPVLAGAPVFDDDVDELIRHRIRPAVWNLEMLRRFERAGPVLAIDTGMQRFACPASELESMMNAHRFDEAFTHAAQRERVDLLRQLVENRIRRLHAAGSALLDDPTCWLNAVRPGIALYRNAITITTPLVEVRDGSGPVGYSGFESSRHGVILCGFTNGLRPGPCFIGDCVQKVIEVGMQSAFVAIGPNDRVGDQVELLGKNVPLDSIAGDWKCPEQEVLTTMNRIGFGE